MNYRQLEEAINKWTLDLEEQEKIFLNQATQVNGWDRLLTNNGDKIVALFDLVEKVKLDQQVVFFCFFYYEPSFSFPASLGIIFHILRYVSKMGRSRLIILLKKYL